MHYSVIDVIYAEDQLLYEIQDANGQLYKVDFTRLKGLISEGHTLTNVHIPDEGTVQILSPLHILNLSREQLSQGIFVYTGEKLLNLVLSSPNITYKQRDFVGEILDYIDFKPPYQEYKLMAVCGLRRTGKTVGLYQVIHHMLQSGVQPDQIAFVDIKANNLDCESLYGVINDLNQRYIFIDEVTNVQRLIGTGAVLYDFLRISSRMVIAGTDSFAFPIALHTSLFDRAYLIRTTYVSYREYTALFGTGSDDYYMTGGTLTKALPYGIRHYIDEQLARNICNTLKRNSTIDYWPVGYYTFPSMGLEDMIHQIVQILVSATNTVGKGYTSFKIEDAFQETILRLSGFLDESDMQPWNRQVIRALEELGIVYRIPNLAFTTEKLVRTSRFELVSQPQALVYALLTEIYRDRGDVSKIVGKSMENLVLVECCEFLARYRAQENADVGYFQYKEADKSHEIDAVIRYPYRKQREHYLIEIKHSQKPKSHFAHNLMDFRLHEYAKHIRGRYVVYLGKTQKIRDIVYIHLTDFLSDLEHWIG